VEQMAYMYNDYGGVGGGLGGLRKVNTLQVNFGNSEIIM
jgi:hypothetical protein